MAVLKQSTLAHINEDLEQVIYNVDNTLTPVTGMIDKIKASAVNHQWLVEDLNAVNIDNAAVEGADFADTTLTKPTRVSNYTQIFTKVINVSGTTRAVDSVGGDELLRQVVKAGKELKRDIEANLVSNKASVAPIGTTAGRLGGMESFIVTNVNAGTGGSSTGYAAGVVNAPTDGTTRALTEALFQAVQKSIFTAGGELKKVVVSPTKKQFISANFTGASAKQFDAKDKTVYASTDIYRGDFGTLDIMTSLYVRDRTVLLVDPAQWAIATLRKMQTEDLAKTADADRKSLLTELTLVCRNEKGNGKIADLS